MLPRGSHDLASILEPYASIMIFIVSAAAVGSIFALVPFYATYRVIFELLQPIPMERQLFGFAVVAVGSIAARRIFLGFADAGARRAAFDVVDHTRLRLLAHLGRLPLDLATAGGPGQRRALLESDVNAIGAFVLSAFPAIGAAVILPPITVCFLAALNGPLAALCGLAVPLAILMQFARIVAGSTRSFAYRASSDELEAAILEFVRALPILRTFALPIERFRRLRDARGQYAQARPLTLSERVLDTLFELTGLLPVLALVPLGAYDIVRGALTVPQLMLFVMTGLGLIAPFARLTHIADMYLDVAASAARIGEVLRALPLPTTNQPVELREHALHVSNVCFAYADATGKRGRRLVLDGVSLDIPSPGITAIVGPSGSGKTTLARMIARYADPLDGSITVGGQALREIPLAQLAALQSIVFQDVFLFSDSIAANLRMGKVVDDAVLFAATRAAYADDIVASVDGGLAAVLGDRGAGLSFGQRQRLAIARALVHDAPVIILDEATAYADAESEAQVQAGLDRIIEGRTLVVIAHRLATIRDADRICVLNAGRVEAFGRHADVYRDSPTYRRLWDQQHAPVEWRVTR